MRSLYCLMPERPLRKMAMVFRKMALWPSWVSGILTVCSYAWHASNTIRFQVHEQKRNHCRLKTGVHAD